MQSCLCFLGVIILIVLGCKYFINIKEKEKLENKHKKLEKLKLEREIKDLEVEINLQEVSIKKKIKEFFEEDIEGLEIKEVYEKLKDKITPCKIDDALKNIENLICIEVYENELESIKNNLNFIKENQKIENLLKDIAILKKLKNEKEILKKKEDNFKMFYFDKICFFCKVEEVKNDSENKKTKK